MSAVNVFACPIAPNLSVELTGAGEVAGFAESTRNANPGVACIHRGVAMDYAVARTIAGLARMTAPADVVGSVRLGHASSRRVPGGTAGPMGAVGRVALAQGSRTPALRASVCARPIVRA